MLQRSVPMYQECQDLAVHWCTKYAKPSTSVYDLGCSTGKFLLKLAEKLEQPKILIPRGDITKENVEKSIAYTIEQGVNAYRQDLWATIYNQAIKIKPNFFEAYSNRGSVLKALNKLEEALNSCNEAIKINSKYAEAYNNRGIILAELKQVGAALENYENAIKINPNFSDAYNNQGVLLIELKRLDDAKESFESALKINPDSNFLLGRLIATKNNLCDWNSFIENSEKLKNNIEKNKKSSSPFNLLSIYDLPELQKKFTEIFVKEEYPETNSIDPIIKKKPKKKNTFGLLFS